jgi:hypothetical protein
MHVGGKKACVPHPRVAGAMESWTTACYNACAGRRRLSVTAFIARP